jgi:hypothetical protein
MTKLAVHVRNCVYRPCGMCRKILVYVAAEKGANTLPKFAVRISHLAIRALSLDDEDLGGGFRPGRYLLLLNRDSVTALRMTRSG